MSMVIIVLVPFSGVMIPLMIISGMILEKGKLTKVLLIAFLLIAGGLFLCMAGWGISRFLRSPQSQLELIVGLIIFIIIGLFRRRRRGRKNKENNAQIH